MFINQDLNLLVNPFLTVMIQRGNELLLPRVLASDFIRLAMQLKVPLDGVTAWGYIFSSDAGIKDHYNDDYWIELSNTSSAEDIRQTLQSIQKHIDQLPEYVHLLGFEIYVEIPTAS
jgi:hypothetical protein